MEALPSIFQGFMFQLLLHTKHFKLDGLNNNNFIFFRNLLCVELNRDMSSLLYVASAEKVRLGDGGFAFK